MTNYELEVAAYAAAHKIYTGLPSPDRPCPGGFRSRMIDQIAETIRESLSVHILASTEPGPATEGGSVRPGEVSEQHRPCLHCGLTHTDPVHDICAEPIPEQPGEDNWKQPDWMCFVCRYMNYSVRSRCRNCGLKRGSERHAFIGRLDRPCDVCQLPDRHRIHRNEDDSIIQRNFYVDVLSNETYGIDLLLVGRSGSEQAEKPTEAKTKEVICIVCRINPAGTPTLPGWPLCSECSKDALEDSEPNERSQMLSVMCCGCQRLLSKDGTLIGERLTDGGLIDIQQLIKRLAELRTENLAEFPDKAECDKAARAAGWTDRDPDGTPNHRCPDCQIVEKSPYAGYVESPTGAYIDWGSE